MSSNRTNELPDKQAVSLAFLEQTSVYLHLDPRKAGVQVPVSFTKQPQLVLQVGLNMPVPITDLRVDDSGISCTLSFNRTPHYCVVPWSAIFAMVGDNGRGMVWPDDVPAEVAAQVSEERPKAPPAPVRPPGPKLVAVPESKQEAVKAKRAAAAKKKREAAKERKLAQAAAIAEAPAPVKPTAEVPRSAPPGTKKPLPPYLRIIK
ncbi:MAG: ClpXP protease specificity-enhancing factor SspB [Polyangiaceae bacterium]|nr:ClpXP protease specificity-enhancing factor SspB [Polyangiaceae bacterium]